MAIIIETMDKPTSCWKCPFLTEEEWRCLAANRHVYNVEQPIPAWCPIEEAETKKGRWLPDEWVDYDDGTSRLIMKCSLCGGQIGGLVDYCPYCGAKMGEDDDGR